MGFGQVQRTLQRTPSAGGQQRMCFCLRCLPLGSGPPTKLSQEERYGRDGSNPADDLGPQKKKRDKTPLQHDPETFFQNFPACYHQRAHRAKCRMGIDAGLAFNIHVT